MNGQFFANSSKDESFEPITTGRQLDGLAVQTAFNRSQCSTTTIYTSKGYQVKRVFLATSANTVALLLWGLIYWGVLYEPLNVFNDLPNQQSVAQLLQDNQTPTGTYFYPWPRNSTAAMADWLKNHIEGPIFRLSYVEVGVNPQSPVKLIIGGIHYFVVSLIGCWLLTLTGYSLNTFGKRLLAVFLAGSLGTLYIQLSDAIWLHLPWWHTLSQVLYDLVSWLIMGTILGNMVKPRSKSIFN